MGRSRYKILDENYPYFITSSLVTKLPMLLDHSTIILGGLEFLIKKRLVKIYAFVIMLDHIHFIAQGNNLAKHISSFKLFTARQIINSLKNTGKANQLSVLRNSKLTHKTDREYQVWSEGFHPKQVFSDEIMEQKIKYIHYNPVKAQLVANKFDWSLSSARFYNGNDCELPLTLFGDWGAPTQSIGAR
ncbi:MAG: transposase [Balneola sp.]